MSPPPRHSSTLLESRATARCSSAIALCELKLGSIPIADCFLLGCGLNREGARGGAALTARVAATLNVGDINPVARSGLQGSLKSSSPEPRSFLRLVRSYPSSLTFPHEGSMHCVSRLTRVLVAFPSDCFSRAVSLLSRHRWRFHGLKRGSLAIRTAANTCPPSEYTGEYLSPSHHGTRLSFSWRCKAACLGMARRASNCSDGCSPAK